MKSSEALIVFFKVPEPGKVKTRLIPFFSPEKASLLYSCFLRDIFSNVSKHHFDVIAFSIGSLSNKTPIIETLDSLGIRVISQVGENLGKRMSNAFQFCFNEGYKRVVIIGSDSPDLPSEFFHTAFDALNSNNSTIVIAPALDGGYVLLGMNSFFKEIFEDVTYSCNSTYIETIAKIKTCEATFVELKSWYDIDEPDDIRKLINSTHPQMIPNTLNFLSQNL